MGEWPVRPAPGKELLRRIVIDGHAISDAELCKLRRDRDLAYDLEFSDPSFCRAARKWRAAHNERQRVDQVHRVIAEKSQMSKVAQDKRLEHIERQRLEREARMQKSTKNRDAVRQAQRRQRQEMLARIALDERRAMVRDTVRAALLTQSRDEQKHDRQMFNDPALLAAWTPPPGAYEVPAPKLRGASFGAHATVSPSRREQKPEPGPGAYDPKLDPGIRYTMRGARDTSALSCTGVVSPSV